METLTRPTVRWRWWVLGAGGVLGMLASLVTSGPAGCIYPDKCIKVLSSGHDWCRNLTNALQWPAEGSIEDAQPVIYDDGAVPQGCVCFNDAEQQILEDKVPECQYEQLLDDIEQAARQECQAVVLPGFNHNCWTLSGPEASNIEPEFFDDPGTCIGNCEYGGPPAGGSCPDPNPYECATSDGGFEGCESNEGADTGGSSGGDESEGALFDPAQAIRCDGHECEIDEAFARALYSDPSLLIAQGTQLVYDSTTRRHTLSGITPDTIAYRLGLRSGDRLEHINGALIDDLDSAIQVYLDNRTATSVEVRIRRQSEWVDFTYTFVP